MLDTATLDRLKECAACAHRNLWARFMDEKYVMLDYAGLNGEVELPTSEECEAGKPNQLAWWMPIENGGFFNGAYLVEQLQRYACEKSDALRDEIRKLVGGLLHLQDVGTTPGFIARGTGSDGQCHYAASSNDQNMPWLVGLWMYVSSDIPSDTEKADYRGRMQRQIEAIRDAGWTIPGDKPGFERGSLIREDNDLECWLSCVHMLLVTRLLALLTGDESDNAFYRQCANEKMKNGKTRIETVGGGLAEFRVPFGWFVGNSQYPLREMYKIETDPEFKRQYKNSLVAIGRGAAKAVSCYKEYDPAADYGFTPDWRVMNKAWREQKNCADAQSVAGEQIEIWREVSPAISVEKKSVMYSLSAAWLVMLSGDSELIEQCLPEIAQAITHFDYNRLYYSAFFYVENLVQEIVEYHEG